MYFLLHLGDFSNAKVKTFYWQRNKRLLQILPISKINFELLLIYNFTVNKYRLACKENKPKVLLALEKQIGGRNPATFTVLCRSLSTSLVKLLSTSRNC